jgi:hypothetical protein
MRPVDEKCGEITDAEVLQLFRELQRVTGVDPVDYAGFTVLQFLQQCLCPMGGTRAARITPKAIGLAEHYETFLLRKPCGKVGAVLQRLLGGLAHGLEPHAGTAVYMLLNRTLVPPPRKGPRRR